MKKTADPGPTSYDIAGSHKFAHGARSMFAGKEAIGKGKRVSFCVQQAETNISPGPAKHVYSIKTLEKLSLSPTVSRRRL